MEYSAVLTCISAREKGRRQRGISSDWSVVFHNLLMTALEEGVDRSNIEDSLGGEARFEFSVPEV
jgi:hypothetical protein